MYRPKCPGITIKVHYSKVNLLFNQLLLCVYDPNISILKGQQFIIINHSHKIICMSTNLHVHG